MAYSRVLVPTDLSEGAARAAHLAGVLGGAGAKHRLLHVLPPPLDGDGLPARDADLIARFVEERRDALRLEVAAWGRKAGLPNATIALRHGSVPREIADEAAAFDADLVALGARGRSRVERLLLGSSARAALHRLARADLLVARPGPERPARVLVATDFGSPSREAAQRALVVAREQGAQVLALHAIEPGPWGDALQTGVPPGAGHEARREAARAALARFNAESLGGSAVEVLLEGRPAHETAAFVAEHGVDLLVVGTHGGGPLERALLGSVAEALVERAPCSVLVVGK